MDFYDEIAGDYDAITGSAGRASQAAAFASELVSRYGVRSVLDAACGTGVYAIALAKMGVRAVGVDISTSMLAQARLRAAEADVSVDWICAAMQDLPAEVRERFDTVLCMGNSIPHLLTDADLEAALGGFATLLGPGGMAVVQLLNYSLLLERQERVVGINRCGDKEYVRFYDFLGDRVRFNILEITWPGEKPRQRIHSTILRPYTAGHLRQALTRGGFASVQAFGGMRFAPFEESQAETVMLLARKG